jgi:hypothetical protein
VYISRQTKISKHLAKDWISYDLHIEGPLISDVLKRKLEALREIINVDNNRKNAYTAEIKGSLAHYTAQSL